MYFCDLVDSDGRMPSGEKPVRFCARCTSGRRSPGAQRSQFEDMTWPKPACRDHGDRHQIRGQGGMSHVEDYLHGSPLLLCARRSAPHGGLSQGERPEFPAVGVAVSLDAAARSEGRTPPTPNRPTQPWPNTHPIPMISQRSRLSSWLNPLNGIAPSDRIMIRHGDQTRDPNQRSRSDLMCIIPRWDH